MSKALRLRSLALMAGGDGGLDLTGRIDLPAAVMADLREVLAETKGRGGDVLITGCGLEGLMARLLDAMAGWEGAIDVVDAKVPAGGRRGVRMVAGPPDDYAVDPEAADRDLRANPVGSFEEMRERLAAIDARRREHPLVADGTKTLVIQDLLANRLDQVAFGRALGEGFRVLALDGMLYLTAFLADEPAAAPGPATVAGGLLRLPMELEILDLLRRAGFHGPTLTPLHDAPVLVRGGVEARAFAIRAYKGTAGPCYDQGHAVIYRGPWSQVSDDDGHVYRRGERTAVCRKTYDVLMRAPYAGQFIGLPCYLEPPLSEAPLFDCATPALRDPAVTKGRIPLRAVGDMCCDTSSAGGGCC